MRAWDVVGLYAGRFGFGVAWDRQECGCCSSFFLEAGLMRVGAREMWMSRLTYRQTCCLRYRVSSLHVKMWWWLSHTDYRHLPLLLLRRHLGYCRWYHSQARMSLDKQRRLRLRTTEKDCSREEQPRVPNQKKSCPVVGSLGGTGIGGKAS